jgi:hypothetical protein
VCVCVCLVVCVCVFGCVCEYINIYTPSQAGADARACDSFGRTAMHLLLLQGIGCPTCTYECAERRKFSRVLHIVALYSEYSSY